MCVIASHNAGEIEAMISLARRHGVYLVLQPYHPNKTGEFSLAAELAAETIASIRSEARNGGALLNSQRYVEGLVKYRPGQRGASCAAGHKYFSIDPQGYVHACVDMPAAGHLFRDGLDCCRARAPACGLQSARGAGIASGAKRTARCRSPAAAIRQGWRTA